MTKQYPIAKEGWIFILPLMVLTIAVYAVARWWMLIPGVLLVFTAFFFRNPTRAVPDIDGIIVAPADGVVMAVEETFEDKYIDMESVRVSIFLSIFNVHINRTPVEGKVEYVERIPGRFMPAYKSEAGYWNAKNCLGLDTRWGKVLVVQITGLIARRIVCWAKEGDILSTGERYGLIRFGSCTEVFLPKNVELNVRPGDKVKGGKTILGRFYN